MPKGKLIAALLICCLAPSAGAAEYAEGQIWSYLTRPGEEESRLYIARIDHDLPVSPIYHLYVVGLRIESPLGNGSIQDRLPHIPVDKSTLDDSVIDLVGIVPNPPDISEGYSIWREAFDAGEAGVFNIPVSEIVQIVEETLRRGGRKPH